MPTRHKETAEQNTAAWACTALAMGGATPWEWATRVASEEVSLDEVPRQYRSMIEKYLYIKQCRESLVI